MARIRRPTARLVEAVSGLTQWTPSQFVEINGSHFAGETDDTLFYGMLVSYDRDKEAASYTLWKGSEFMNETAVLYEDNELVRDLYILPGQCQLPSPRLLNECRGTIDGEESEEDEWLEEPVPISVPDTSGIQTGSKRSRSGTSVISTSHKDRKSKESHVAHILGAEATLYSSCARKEQGTWRLRAEPSLPQHDTGVTIDDISVKTAFKQLSTPVEAFCLLFSDEFLGALVLHTNVELRAQGLESTCVEEIRNFIIVWIACNCPGSPVVESDAWTKHSRVSATFLLTRARYRQIKGHIRCYTNNNECRQTGWQVQELLQRFRWATAQLINPGNALSLDEAMVAWTGPLSFLINIPTKPDPVGIRMFVLSDPSTGFTHDVIMDVGDDTMLHNTDIFQKHASRLSHGTKVTSFDEFVECEGAVRRADAWLTDDLGKTGAIMACLASTAMVHYEDGIRSVVNMRSKPFILYVDRYYTQVRRMQALKSKGVLVAGTLMASRLPYAVKQWYNDNYINDKRTMREGQTFMWQQGFEGYAETSTFDRLTLWTWQDNGSRPVHFISSAHSIREKFITVTRRRKGHAQKVEVHAPAIVQAYNRKMRGVDAGDAAIKRLWVRRTRPRWTQRVMEWVFAQALHNAHQLFVLATGKKTSGRLFLQAITNVASPTADYALQSRPILLDDPKSVTAHWPQRAFQADSHGARCVVCKKYTRWECATCKVPICVGKDARCGLAHAG